MRPRARRRGKYLLPLGLVPMLAAACSDTRLDPMSCHEHACPAGFVCLRTDADSRCVPSADAASVDVLDVPPAVDLSPPALEVGRAEVPVVDVTADVPAVAVDAPVDVGLDAPSTPVDAALEVTLDAAVDVAVDTYVPDAAGTCAVDKDCAGSTPYCVAGSCVACKTSAECQGGAPICSPAHACVSCAMADAGCPASAPACEVDSGRCVECVSGDGCLEPTKPICDPVSNTCVPCTRDEQCAGRGPSVCMAHLDGHCATDSETLYVGSSTCSDTATNAGTRSVPFCTAQRGVLAARAKGKALVVLAGGLAGGFTGLALTAPLTVVGKDAIVNAADYSDGISLTSGELYLRDLTVAGSASRYTGIGINAQATAGAALILHMSGCTVRSNPGGGILLAGAAFAIENTIVTGNGPGETVGGTSFGGMRIDSAVAAGPASLALVSITDNLAPGLSCASGIQGSGVLSSGNAVQNVTSSCGIVSCAAAGPTCGAQP